MDDFDVVVVGSGFGGSVTAYRLAAAGRTVCLLERGQAHPPGNFARRPREMRGNFWDPSKGRYGLFDLWSFGHIDAAVSAGLGGGSLIYANVLLRKDEKWFVHDGARGDAYENCPITRRDLEPHYNNVERVLTPTIYPYDTITSKTQGMRAAARLLRIEETTYDRVDPAKPQFFLPPLAITFAAPGEAPKPGVPLPGAPHDAKRETCRLCGECDIGCNFGAKNTLDLTYLRKASALGADIRTLCEVKSFDPGPSGRGFTIHYLAHDKERTSRRAAPSQHKTVRARVLILAAGTLGTTFLMLANSARLSRTSRPLGSRFSGNGDLLTVAFNTHEMKPDSRKSKPRLIDPTHGPVITSAFRFPDSLDCGVGAERGFYLQDAGYPELVDWLLQEADVRGNARRLLRFARIAMVRLLTGRGRADVSRTVAALFGSGRLSYSTLTLLGMGRDVPSGRLGVRGRHHPQLTLAWNRRGSRAYFDRAIEQAERISVALDGEFVQNPMMHYLNHLITAHPVGGCPMGRNEKDAVVDSYGAVFGYDGLYIADGSIMPSAVGANPSFTIAAMADRIAESIIARFPAGAA